MVGFAHPAAGAAGLITVWHDVAPEHEHLARALARPGFVRARRYSVDDAPLKHLVWYETADASIEPGPDDSEAGERMSFTLMRDVGRVPATDTPWLYIVHTDIPDDIVGEYNEWYDREHLPRLVTVPGVIRARRYNAVAGNPRYLTAYELTDRDAFESPEGLLARKTPWTAKMRSLFYNTRRRMCRLDP